MDSDISVKRKSSANRPKRVSDGPQKNKKKKYNLKKIAVFAGVFVFIVYAGYVLIWQQFTISKKIAEIDALQQQITEASDETERLKQELEEVNDPEYLERIAREKLGLVQANERVFVDSNKGD